MATDSLGRQSLRKFTQQLRNKTHSAQAEKLASRASATAEAWHARVALPIPDALGFDLGRIFDPQLEAEFARSRHCYGAAFIAEQSTYCTATICGIDADLTSSKNIVAAGILS